MTAFWLAPGVGVIAFLFGITTFFNRDERRFKKQLSVYSAVIGVHFFLLGTYPAGASAILNAIRAGPGRGCHRLSDWYHNIFQS